MNRMNFQHFEWALLRFSAPSARQQTDHPSILVQNFFTFSILQSVFVSSVNKHYFKMNFRGICEGICHSHIHKSDLVIYQLCRAENRNNNSAGVICHLAVFGPISSALSSFSFPSFLLQIFIFMMNSIAYQLTLAHTKQLSFVLHTTI